MAARRYSERLDDVLYVTGASWDSDELWFKRSKVKVTLSLRGRPALDAVVEFSFLVVVSLS